MLEFRVLAERVRVCQERLEKQEQALEDVSHVIHSETCGLCGYPINTASCQLFQRIDVLAGHLFIAMCTMVIPTPF